MKQVPGKQAPAKPREKSSDGKCKDLVLQDMDSVCRSCRFVFSDGPQGQTNPGPYHEIYHGSRKEGQKEAGPVIGLHGFEDSGGEMQAIRSARKGASL